jgi:hypothetical protein
MNGSAAPPEARVETGAREERGSRRPVRGERGATQLEFALVMSAMIVVTVVGIAGFALYLSNYLALHDAVSVSTRQVAISAGLTGVDPCGVVTTAANAAYQAAAFESTTPSLTPTLTVYFPTTTTITYGPTPSTSCTAAAPFLVPGAIVEVSISHATSSLFGSYGNFTVNAQAEGIVQGVAQ